MALLELPHTPNCVVCGRANPHGLHLSFYVNTTDGSIHSRFTPTAQHIGFESIAHGGVLATIFDEAMVWAATWRYKKFCVCAELTVRFVRPATIGQALTITACVESFRPRLTTTTAEVLDADGQVLAEGAGKYMPMSAAQHRSAVASFVSEPTTAETAAALKSSDDRPNGLRID